MPMLPVTPDWVRLPERLVKPSLRDIKWTRGYFGYSPAFENEENEIDGVTPMLRGLKGDRLPKNPLNARSWGHFLLYSTILAAGLHSLQVTLIQVNIRF